MAATFKYVARRANREDDVSRRFFEGRFSCREIGDEGARLVCGLYVDLNPIPFPAMTDACVEPLPLCRRRDLQASELWRLLDQHFETFQPVYDERFQARYGFWPRSLSVA